MIDKAARVIKSSAKVSIIAHTSPDADTLGSCFAFKEALSILDKTADIYLDCEIPEYLSFFEGEFLIYKPENIKTDADLCICIDCADLERVGQRSKLLESATNSINIDHHPTNTEYAKINIVDPQAAATAEIIYDLIKELGVKINKYIAKNLYTAIVGDTGGFRYSNTTVKTHKVAAELLNTGIEGWRFCNYLFESNLENVMKIKCETILDLDVFAGGKAGIAVVDKNLLKKYELSADEVDGIVEMIRSIKGIEVAVFVKQKEDHYKISMRSSEYADVSKIAVKYGGGGHKRAAGFSINKDKLEFVINIIKKEVLEALKS